MESLLRTLESKEHVIWDWNGTLLDDVELAVEAIGEVLTLNGLTPIGRDHYRDTFCFPIPEYYRRLGLASEGPGFETVTRQFVEGYRKRVPHSRLRQGIQSVLEGVKGTGLRQSILSAAHEADLHHHLAHFGIRDLFDHVFGLSDHYAVSKLERGRQLLETSGVDPKATLLVGDTDHDWEVGRALGIQVIILPDGHQSLERLQALGAPLLAPSNGR